MRTSWIAMAQALAWAALATEGYAPKVADKLQRRQVMTCEQTYGAGSVACGGSGSTFCYNPSKGQICCPDKGYCDSGEFCAPVPGYCCKEGEDLTTCAQRAGFQLPAALTATPSAAAEAAQTSPTGRGFVVTPFLPNTASGASTADPAAATDTPSSSAMPNYIIGSQAAAGYGNMSAMPTGWYPNTTMTGIVEVSAAGKEDPALMKLVAGVGIAAMIAVCL